MVLSVDNYVPSAYTAGYNRKEQGTVADYVIVMGYDEHFAGGEKGSTASLGFVEQGIRDTLQEVPKEKVINAVPFYTRLWQEKDGETTSSALGIYKAKDWIEENHVELSCRMKQASITGILRSQTEPWTISGWRRSVPLA